jgi:hypothetical protein
MDFGDLVPIGVAFVVVGIVLAFGLSILSDVNTDFVAGSAARNATDDAIEGAGELASKLPLLGLVIAAAIIIGVLLKSFRA